MSDTKTPPTTTSSSSPGESVPARLLERLKEMTATITSLRAEVKWLWEKLLGERPEIFVLGLVALALKAASGDDKALSDMMSGFGRLLGVDRWAVFQFDKKSRPRLLVGAGPDLPARGEVVETATSQALQLMRVLSGSKRYVVCPAEGVAFDAFFGLKDETGNVWGVLGLDDMSSAREFTPAEMTRIEEAVFLLEAVFNHRRRIEAEEIGLDTDPPGVRSVTPAPTPAATDTDARTQMLGDGTPAVGHGARTVVLGGSGPGGHDDSGDKSR